MGVWIPSQNLNTHLFEVRILNGSVFQCSVYVVCPPHYTNLCKTGPVHKKTRWRPLSGIQMAGIPGIQMALEYWTIWCPTSFGPFEYQTSLVFRSPLYTFFNEAYLKVAELYPNVLYCDWYYATFSSSHSKMLVVAVHKMHRAGDIH